MINLLIYFTFYFIASYYITTVIVRGDIFAGLRGYIMGKSETLYNLISCDMCLGFWVGLFISLAFTAMGGVRPTTFTEMPIVIENIFDAYITAGFIHIIYATIDE